MVKKMNRNMKKTLRQCVTEASPKKLNDSALGRKALYEKKQQDKNEQNPNAMKITQKE